MAAVNVANSMKIAAMCTMGPLGLVGCIQGAKMYRNWTHSEDDASTDRQAGVANRISAGCNLANFNAKYLEKQLKTNSALQRHAAEIRAAHAVANPSATIDGRIA